MPFKKLPYGNCNFADIIESGYAYVDKTRYLELLEEEGNRYQFMLRFAAIVFSGKGDYEAAAAGGGANGG